MVTFLDIPECASDGKFDIGLSDDRRALTIGFSDFQVAAGGANAPGPTVTRITSLVIPLSGEDKSVEVEFLVSSFVKTLVGSTATLVMSVNGQTSVADFPEDSDQSFVQKLTFTAATPSELRLCFFVVVGRDSTNSDSEGLVSVSAIDVEILPRPK